MRFLCKGNTLTASIYIDLHRKVNFEEYRREDVETVITNSLYFVVVFDDKRPIGIACIVGDNRIAFFIKNVVVDPAYQKNRIGNPLMQKLQGYPIGAVCEGAYIDFVSTSNYVPSYRKHGFLERLYDRVGLGIVRFYDPYEMRE